MTSLTYSVSLRTYSSESTVTQMRIKNKVDVLMNYFMKLPNDMFQQQLLQYVTVYDIVFLDNACMNHRYRSQLLDKISGVILIGDLINALS